MVAVGRWSIAYSKKMEATTISHFMKPILIWLVCVWLIPSLRTVDSFIRNFDHCKQNEKFRSIKIKTKLSWIIEHEEFQRYLMRIWSNASNIIILAFNMGPKCRQYTDRGWPLCQRWTLKILYKTRSSVRD